MNHPPQPTCLREILARTSIGSIELCRCGAAHLTIGAVTLRLAPEAIAELAELLGRAAGELDRRVEARAARRFEAAS